MRLIALLLASILTAGTAVGQSAATSPANATPPPAADSVPIDPAALHRIRDGLKTTPERPLVQQGLERTADFRVEVLEEAKFYEFLSSLRVKSGPAPAGGLYGYEQQQRAFNPVDRPLSQPYAAFSGGELITIAIQNILGRYLAGKIMNAARTHEAQAAEDEVAREILAYCGSRPDRARIAICTPQP